ncbi:MAG: excinuclease ABC subunit C [Calditrichaeota bacterium]|nr:MAG: excinuclease ABC subunit C [Calditrichota bacterium]
MSHSVAEKLETLSPKPGVYLFKDKSGNIIYVGKAKVLRNRVRSYFQDKKRLDAKTLHLVARIADLETIITDTEVEALILEAALVKEHQPRYNINLKDDKSFPYIRVTHETFPRIFPTRKIIKDGSRYFGPYTDVLRLKTLLSTIKKLFPIRSCKLPLEPASIREGKFKVCLNYHIHRCHGPCEGFISAEEYQRTIEYIVEFIKGHTQFIEKDLKTRMQLLASELKFEQAARLRDQLKSVEMFSQRQKVLDPELADRDLISLATEDEFACCVVFKVRQGRIIGKDFFILEHVEGEEIRTVLRVFLQQFYFDSQDIPPEILVPIALAEELDTFEAWLAQKREKKVRIVLPQRGEKARLLEMCKKNARFHLSEFLLKKQQAAEYIAGSVKALQKALKLSLPPKRIEGFDISNIQGTFPVASMVCFINGRPAKAEYRRFKIRSKETPDDFAMMHEVVKRRYGRLEKEGKPLPDLILIDGGKGQLSAAISALKTLTIELPPIVALAKRLDEIFVPDVAEAQNIPRDSSGLKLLQRIRDESHRFAVTFHRQLRSKNALISELDAIPGIGLKRRQKLIRTFGSVVRLKKASSAELQQVEGISVKLAEQIIAHWQKQEKRDVS